MTGTVTNTVQPEGSKEYKEETITFDTDSRKASVAEHTGVTVDLYMSEKKTATEKEEWDAEGVEHHGWTLYKDEARTQKYGGITLRVEPGQDDVYRFATLEDINRERERKAREGFNFS